jgi:hypothetical protein
MAVGGEGRRGGLVRGGPFWWPAAVVAAYMSALTNAWVLLIEILG